MKNKWFAVFAVLVSAFVGCDNGTGANGLDDGNVITVNSFDALANEIKNPNTTKTIRLVAGTYNATKALMIQHHSDITILPPSSGKVTLKAPAGMSGYFMAVLESSTLTLGKDGAAADSLVIDGNVARTNSNPIVGLTSVDSSFIMKDGVLLTNNKGTSSQTYGAVSVTKGLFVMKGGKIANNFAHNSGGGGVSITQGEFIMEGGVISGNTASGSSTFGNGGGVSVGGTYDAGRFTMKGGVIRGNTAGNQGGGVYVSNSGTFVMEGGTIKGFHPSDGDSNKAGSSNASGNEGSNGAAVYLYGGSMGTVKYTSGDFSLFQATETTIIAP